MYGKMRDHRTHVCGKGCSFLDTCVLGLKGWENQGLCAGEWRFHGQ